jgi:hypothetical protein
MDLEMPADGMMLLRDCSNFFASGELIWRTAGFGFLNGGVV